MSKDEKRTRVLDYFYEKKEFFHLKELEKDIPKVKGVIAQSVKEIVTELVNDNLVDSDKIGTSTYFWAFPSKARHLKKQQLEDLKKQLEEANKKLKVSREKVIAAKIGREETEKRLQLLERLQSMKVDEERLTAEIQKYKDSDPETFEKMKKEIQIAKDAANRWTDNVFSVKSWCKDKFGLDEGALDKAFEIPADFDNID